MTYLTLNYPNLAEGAEVEIDGLGIFVNGQANEVSSEDEATFRQRLGGQVEVYAPDPEDETKQVVVGAVYQAGPTLAQYFKDNPYVTVSRTPPKEEDPVVFEESKDPPRAQQTSTTADSSSAPANAPVQEVKKND